MMDIGQIVGEAPNQSEEVTVVPNVVVSKEEEE